MDEDIILSVKLMAVDLEVPLYVITEHLLQVGTYYVLTAIEDENKRRTSEEHLVKIHLLGSALGDAEDVLTLRKDD